MYPQLLQFAGFLLLWTGANAVVDCADENSMVQEQLKCFEKFSITVGASGDLNTALQNNAASLCGYSEAVFREVLTCAFGIGKTCLIQLSVNPNVLPSADRVADGIAYMCRQNISELNPSCVQTSQPAFVECVNAKAQIYARTHSKPNTVEEYTCAGMSLAYDCMKSTLGNSCENEQFVRIYLTFINDYLRPPVCGSFNSATSVYGLPVVVTMLLATVLGLFVTY